MIVPVEKFFYQYCEGSGMIQEKKEKGVKICYSRFISNGTEVKLTLHEFFPLTSSVSLQLDLIATNGETESKFSSKIVIMYSCSRDSLGWYVRSLLAEATKDLWDSFR